MTVYVTFARIHHNDHALIWSFNEQNNSATLTFKTEGGPEKVKASRRAKILNQLRSLGNLNAGMVFGEDSVTISDVKTFQKSFALNYIASQDDEKRHRRIQEKDRSKSLGDFKNPSPPHSPAGSPKERYLETKPKKLKREKTSAEKRGFLSRFFSTGTQPTRDKPLSAETMTFPQDVEDTYDEPDLSTVSPEIIEKRNQFLTILIQDLFVKELDGNMFRTTLAKKDTFLSLNQSKVNSISEYLRSLTSFTVAANSAKMQEFYPANGQAIQIYEEMLERILNPIYSTWAKTNNTEHREQLFLYLQKAVHKAINLEPYEAEPNHLELMTPSELYARFKGNKALWTEAIHLEYEIGVRLRLVYLRYFIDNSLSIDLILPWSTLIPLSTVAQFYHSVLPLYKELIEDEVSIGKNHLQISAIVSGIQSLIPYYPELANEIAKQKGDIDPEIPRQTLDKIEHFIKLRLVQIRAINSFREALQSNPEQVREIAELLNRAVIIGSEVVKIENKYRVIFDTLHQDLNQVPAETIDNNKFWSFKHLIHHYLAAKFKAHKKNHALIETEVNQLTAMITARVIELLDHNDNTSLIQVVPRLPAVIEKNFYLCRDWKIGVSRALESIDLAELIKNTNKDKVAKCVDVIAETVKEFFNQKSIKLLRSSPLSSQEESSREHEQRTTRTMSCS